jgi:superfamily II DNA or RNA helicase
VKLVAPDVARHTIASEWLRADTVSATLGPVTLRPHQLDAVRRLGALLEDAGGALLCDEVGLGKTYVALALARQRGPTLVVAPASLRDMWRAEAARCGTGISFASAESLSRAPPPRTDHAFVIVDEAHHFRSPATARHRSLALLTARSPVLLLSATPLHNKRGDLIALLSLFLGSAARSLSEEQVAGYMIRRNPGNVADAFPRVASPVRLPIPHDARQLDQLLSLPPPTPPRDGGFAAAMVAHALVRLWASSDAALREALRRRLARTAAIRCALESGTYPTARELRSWTYAEGSLQLGFAELLGTAGSDGSCALLDSTREHEHALVALLASLPRETRADAARVEHVRELRRKHPDAKIIAFSHFSETAAMYYRRLGRERGVAMLTSRGARIASGPITRREALARFAPTSIGGKAGGEAAEISLLIATDLLSEGVNLQDASVVVHLDLPWTAATLEQRVGRIARLGSRHREVFVYSIDPPAPSRDILRAEAIIRRKAELTEACLGHSRIPPLFARGMYARKSDVEDAEETRNILSQWVTANVPPKGSMPLCAVVAAGHRGALLLVTVRGRPRLLAKHGSGMSATLQAVRGAAAMAHGPEAPVPHTYLAQILAEARGWIESELVSSDAGSPRAGRSLLARPIAERLARLLAYCPRHQRAVCSVRIAAIQQRLDFPFTLGVERELEGALATTPDTALLDALDRILGTLRTEGNQPEESSEVRAVLILSTNAVSAQEPW